MLKKLKTVFPRLVFWGLFGLYVLYPSTEDQTGDENKLEFLLVNLVTQTIYECNAAGYYVHPPQPISSGRPGAETPTGYYLIRRLEPKAYSRQHDAWMTEWIGINRDGTLGIHALEGRRYLEDLGTPVSEGHIQISRAYAKDLHKRVAQGMAVVIMDDSEFEPAPAARLCD